jgi:hypothetical protein
MGIKNYLSSLSENFPTMYQTPPGVDILCIDLNTALHPICAHSANNADFKRNLFGYLDKTIRKHRPKKVAIFADGQAVLAKAFTQMKRRQKHLYEADESNTISTLNLTPGTPFMNFIDAIVVEYLESKPNPYYYSPSTVPNEGEIKLFSWLKQFPDARACIIGDDADLIVLSLVNTPLLDVYIYTQKKYISLCRLVQGLSDLVPARAFGLAEHPIRADIGLISLLSGNDYLAHLVSFNKALVAYRSFVKESSGFLVLESGELDMTNFKKFVMRLECPNTSPTFQPSDASDYMRALAWNARLYTGNVVPNFLPRYKGIDVATLRLNVPRMFIVPSIPPTWQHPDVYLLLLMPIVGKRHLPESLQAFMADDSPIRHLFPVPCDACIRFKHVIGEINAQINSLDKLQFRLLISPANAEYRLHIDRAHPHQALPIQEISAALGITSPIR